MKDPFNELKKTVFDEVVRTSRSYVLREHVRAELQQIVSARISSGDINSAADVESFIQAMKAAISVLESVPFESWQMIAGLK